MINKNTKRRRLRKKIKNTRNAINRTNKRFHNDERVTYLEVAIMHEKSSTKLPKNERLTLDTNPTIITDKKKDIIKSVNNWTKKSDNERKHLKKLKRKLSESLT